MKKALIIIGISLLVIIIGLFASAEIFEEKIGATFKESINSTLKSEFHFEAFDLSLVRSFPYATIRFQDVYLLDVKEDTLLQADRAQFKLDIFSLLQSKIKVNATQVENGTINISVDKNGLPNYDIIAPSESTDQSSTRLAIKEARILDMGMPTTCLCWMPLTLIPCAMVSIFLKNLRDLLLLQTLLYLLFLQVVFHYVHI